jgi:hypothetical protein
VVAEQSVAASFGVVLCWAVDGACRRLMFLQRAIVASWVVHRWKGLQASCSSGRRELLSCMRAMPLQVIGCVAQLHRAKLLGNCNAKRRPI